MRETNTASKPMNHTEAIKTAEFVFWDMEMDGGYSDMEAAIRAYLDARGLVMVPMEPTPEMVVSAQLDHEGEYYLPYSLYASMISAAPDPFNDQTTEHEKETT